MLAFLFGQAGQDALGFGVGGQDALHGSQGIGAEAMGSFQGSQPVGPLIVGQQCQDVLGLVFALTLLGEQAVKEALRRRSQFLEAFVQHGQAFALVRASRMDGANLPLAGDGTRQQGMPGDFLDRGAVDDDFMLGDTHRQKPADVAVRHGIEVLPIGEETLGVDAAIEDQGRVVRLCRQRDQVGLVRGKTLQGCLLGLGMDAHPGAPGFADHQAVTSLSWSRL